MSFAQSMHKYVCATFALLAMLLGSSNSQAQVQVLSDFNQTGFDFVFDNFVATPGPESVRLTDFSDGWGGGGFVFNNPIDLSGFSDGRLVVDFTPETSNGVDRFTIEFYDDSPIRRSGKWDFNLTPLTPGQPAQLVSNTILSEPSSGIGDFQNLDLSSIEEWLILGEFGSPQPFDISFDRVAVSNEVAAPPAYNGADPDAPWRAVAQTRIDQHRKADLSVTVVDAAGKVIPNAAVSVEMQNHEFGFGSAVQAHRLRNPNDNNSNNDIYRQKVSELFNQATLENNLKWPAWEGEWGNLWTQQGAVSAIDWLDANGLEARGHVMVWPGSDNLPQDIQQLLSDGNLTTQEQATVRTRIANHIASLGAATNGKIVAWDVINETRTNNDLMQLLNEQDLAMVDWFDLARQAAGDAKLYINDFGIITSGGDTDSPNQQQYYDTIQYLKNQGTDIEGVGIQGHFDVNSLTGPEEVWTILDRFADLGLEMQITEFDFQTTDETLQAEFTRDFMTAIFAHEAMSDFIQWGFWEDAHWRPDAAMFRSDWSIKPNGEAYLDLVFNEWWTDEELDADAAGVATTRGFKGDYLISATVGEETTQVEATLADGGTTLLVTLQLLQGDYNEDGRVDVADFAIWRDNFGSTEFLTADGNNNGTVDLDDYAIWQDNFGATLLPETSLSVPEPTSLLLVGLALAGSFSRRRAAHV